MSVGWTADYLKERIEVCEKDAVTAVARHEAPSKIEGMRKGIELLHRWLLTAEREETENGRNACDRKEY